MYQSHNSFQWNHACFGIRGVSKRTGSNPIHSPSVGWASSLGATISERFEFPGTPYEANHFKEDSWTSTLEPLPSLNRNRLPLLFTFVFCSTCSSSTSFLRSTSPFFCSFISFINP
ncbi:hypothetical protein E2C01_057666 [Portunus trituberculatus]|uniref:Uncharacterized protein n=1 Tax=Portunus trituberculatus TaxID=210409 RepID=A0A5B7H2L1_PORTR|nr:hypothetical protein [Portunus trituberculatus]